MDQDQQLAASQSNAVQSLLEKVRLDVAYVTREKQRVEELALYYQTKIASHAEQSTEQPVDGPSREAPTDTPERPAKRRRSSQSHVEVQARLEAELETSKTLVASLSQEKRLLEEKIQNRDRTMAVDAKQMDQLRQENGRLYALELQLKAKEAELKAAQTQSQRHKMESQLKLTIGEESTRFLNSEILRLSEELTKARFAVDTASASHAASARSSNERNKELSNSLAQAKSQILKMEDYIGSLEGETIAEKSRAERDRKDYEEETARLTEILDLQKDLTKEAEHRVRDYEEIVRSLKEEVEARGKESERKGKLGVHAEVLLKNLQDALDAKMRLLHQQKQEMERARASEMALLAKEEALNREAEDARWETEQAKKEMGRMAAQLKDQARKIALLEKQVEIGSAERQKDTMLGLTENYRSPRRYSQFSGSDFAPQATMQGASSTPNTLQDVDAAVEELASIRRRHHQLMRTMGERRAAYS